MECKKTQYASEQLALDDVKRIGDKSSRSTIPVRAYKCNHCDFWHLTSKENRVEKYIRELLCELDSLKKENTTLRKTSDSGEKLKIKIDSRVAELMKANETLYKENKKLRSDNGDLICRNIQLKSQIEKMSTNQQNQSND